MSQESPVDILRRSVPHGWRPHPLKHGLLRNDSGVWGAEPTGVDDHAVLRSTDITIDGEWRVHDPALRSLTETEASDARLFPGDLVVVKSSGSASHLGKTALADKSTTIDGAAFSNFMQRLRVDADNSPRYIWYLLNSVAGREQINWLGTTTTGLRNLNAEILGAITCPGPPLAVQNAIVAYLDAETARIDALIAKKRRMMALAQERFITLVSFLTQDGPEARVRHLTSLLTSGPRGWAELVSDTGAPFLRSANLQRASVKIKTDNLVHVLPPRTVEAQRSSVCPGDVVMGITGANTGWVGCVPPSLAGGFVSQHVAILRPAHVEPEWLAYSLLSARTQDQLLGGQYGGTKQQLGLQDLAELRIANPDRDEQRRRVETIAKARRESERLIGVLARQMALLAERRQALITAAVTGQFQVPGMAA